MLVKHFEAAELFVSDTKYFTSTQIQGILCQAALQQTSLEDIAEQYKKEDETSPTAGTARNAIIAHFNDFSPHEFGKHISSLFQAAVSSSPQYQKLRREPVVFAVDETDLEYAEKDLFSKDGKKATLHNRKKKKVFRYATLVALQKGERPLTLAFLPVLLGQKRKDTVATLLKFVATALKASLDFNGWRGCGDRIISALRCCETCLDLPRKPHEKTGVSNFGI